MASSRLERKERSLGLFGVCKGCCAGGDGNYGDRVCLTLWRKAGLEMAAWSLTSMQIVFKATRWDGDTRCK